MELFIDFNVVTLALYAIIGVVFGSFLNVVLLRFRTRSLFGNAESVCLSCSARLKALDLFPILSYLGLKGRCRKCGSAFSSRYILVEIITGALFGVAYTLYGVSLHSIVMCAFFLFLVLITFYDLEHMIVPDEFSIPFNVLAFISIFTSGNDVLLHIGGGLSASFFFFLLWFITKGRAIGFADGIIALGIGFVLGIPAVFTGIVFAFWIGSVVSVGILLFQKLLKKAPRSARARWNHYVFGSRNTESLHMKSEIPFVPFIAAGFILQLLTHVSVF
jgi:prepilin signal peptidase PulO-like enzyme (type II secretory pathway)